MRISRLARDCWPMKQVMLEVHAGIWKSMTSFISWVTSRFKPSHERPAKLSTWLFFSVPFLIPLPTLYKPSLPMKCKKNKNIHKKLLREKILAKHLRVRGCLPTILYIISLELPFTHTSPSTYPWGVLSPNTYLTHSKFWEKFLCLWEALKEVSEWWMQ